MDTHFEAYYGRNLKSSDIIHNYRKERGGSGSYKYITAVLHTKAFSLVVYCDIIEVHNNFLPKYIEEILEFVINELKINPKKLTVLTDREFKNFEIIKIFERYGCNYICFVPKNDIKYYLEKEYKNL
ncbi:hypothetical protein [Methanotorris formicicus]|uniref:Uncharacterized protein n=1 Tax=Methanotorris formicicus Mc-S-70 TaxID=647171 RepID=H1KZK3_9EURY|nr:hypothetical protein [Methanotorris formicicus]EHP85896.1 hypothetical protein MetfoDRAFT_1226 [Methanotorris formicicus Mc-S-70]